jgi:hypothetical protein
VKFDLMLGTNDLMTSLINSVEDYLTMLLFREFMLASILLKGTTIQLKDMLNCDDIFNHTVALSKKKKMRASN